MVVGGGDPQTDLVELISLDPERVPVPECLKQLSPFPTSIKGAAGGSILPDGHPLICGGKQGLEISNRCFKYSPWNDTWYQSDNMTLGGRFFFGWQYNDKLGLVMTSGHDDLNRLDTFEAIGSPNKHIPLWPRVPYKGITLQPPSVLH